MQTNLAFVNGLIVNNLTLVNFFVSQNLIYSTNPLKDNEQSADSKLILLFKNFTNIRFGIFHVDTYDTKQSKPELHMINFKIVT